MRVASYEEHIFSFEMEGPELQINGGAQAHGGKDQITDEKGHRLHLYHVDVRDGYISSFLNILILLKLQDLLLKQDVLLNPMTLLEPALQVLIVELLEDDAIAMQVQEHAALEEVALLLEVDASALLELELAALELVEELYCEVVFSNWRLIFVHVFFGVCYDEENPDWCLVWSITTWETLFESGLTILELQFGQGAPLLGGKIWQKIKVLGRQSRYEQMSFKEYELVYGFGDIEVGMKIALDICCIGIMEGEVWQM